MIPLHDERANVEVLVARLRAALAGEAEGSWRVVFVDDGSRDGTSEWLVALAEADARFTAVFLSRNFGHMPALLAGLDHADADAVVLMDGDLQDPPENIPALLAAWRAGAEVVHAERSSRARAGWRPVASGLFHLGFRPLASDGWPADVGTFCLLDRRAAAELRRLREPAAFLPGLRNWIGFRQVAVPYERAPRHAGPPRQPPARLFRYAADALFGFSRAPIQLVTLAGAFCVVAAGVLAALGQGVLAGVGLFTAVQVFALAAVGGYVTRTYEQVRGRPPYVVRARVGLPEAPGASGRSVPTSAA